MVSLLDNAAKGIGIAHSHLGGKGNFIVEIESTMLTVGQMPHVHGEAKQIAGVVGKGRVIPLPSNWPMSLLVGCWHCFVFPGWFPEPILPIPSTLPCRRLISCPKNQSCLLQANVSPLVRVPRGSSSTNPASFPPLGLAVVEPLSIARFP